MSVSVYIFIQSSLAMSKVEAFSALKFGCIYDLKRKNEVISHMKSAL